MGKKKITVTSPLLPDLDAYNELLAKIWDSKWITNAGPFHEKLEKALSEYLKVPYLSLFTNGTLPLLSAFQALGIRKGEVITTPYSFVATTHAIWWNGLEPVFADIDKDTCNLDPARIEEAITDRTVAIMPVHCYGTPCDISSIQEIADRHGLKVIYDAAHTFGVEIDGESILKAGDMSTLSFHATKVFNTVEGGAVISGSLEMKEHIDHLRNFGFENEITVTEPGINSKMDELRAAFGLLNLQQVDKAIGKRKKVAERYREALKDVPGIRMLPEPDARVKSNYAYFPIFVDPKTYGMTRDGLYEKMKEHNIYGRRYFYPLISEFSPYSSLPSAAKENLPAANLAADSVVCLPMHHNLDEEDVERIIAEVAR